MANLRTKKLLRTTNPITPPPSPIPTGKGSRSASNDSFARFLHHALRVPGLSLPPTLQPLPDLTPPQVLHLRDDDHDRIRDSAKEFGLVRIGGHGISVHELRSLLIRGGQWNGNREEEMLLWVSCSPTESTDSVRVPIGDSSRDRVLSENMTNIRNKLEAIAEKLCQILLESGRDDQVNHEKIMFEEKECVVYLCKHNHQQQNSQITLNNNENIETQLCLRLQLFIDHSQIYVQSEGGEHFYFDAGPDTLLVTIGKQLQEWSFQDDFKCVTEKIIFVPDESSDYSFSIKLNYFPSNSNVGKSKKISIGDQIVIAIIITLLYKILMFLTSKIVGA